MREIYARSVSGTRTIDGQVLQPHAGDEQDKQNQHRRPDRIVRRINGNRISFRDLAIFAWPDKTENHLSFHLKVDARTARRWLADDNGPPAEALGVILAEIMRRFHQR